MAQRYTVTDLGSLAPAAVNSWAQVVGDSNGHAFLWARGQGMLDLGLLPGGTFSRAVAINDLGTVTGTADGAGTVISPTSDYQNKACADLIQPFLWQRKSGMRGVGTLGFLFYGLPPNISPDTYWCMQDSYGSGINVLGQGIAYTGNELLAFNLYQFGLSWDGTGNFNQFGGGWPPTFANAINITGQIVGQSSNAWYWNVGRATSWKNSVATDLGTLVNGASDEQDYSSAANDVNDLGVTVGWSFTTPFYEDAGTTHAVIWTADGAIADLGTLAGDTLSQAKKINLFGIVIGMSGNTTAAPPDSDGMRKEVVGRPFVWTQSSGMRDLNTLIPANSGWVLSSASGVNVWGQIVGVGVRNGQTHGYLLTPANPFQTF